MSWTCLTLQAAKTRESVAKSPPPVNEKNAGLAWGKAYRALLQFRAAGRYSRADAYQAVPAEGGGRPMLKGTPWEKSCRFFPRARSRRRRNRLKLLSIPASSAKRKTRRRCGC
ncbi:hypothetical protein NITMOv2_4346 [Nitrospira moscoviensis]|uniref:Uncharacterized protein n=1 Tax=Nitrospira moscoviensis TaxID=42253 RepID=A0A0K2GJA9_NITMO|nr:hypothetical protein NITMOv2_4346 [Nitrospira moscoviensis]